jgi:hypothetical protein
MRSEYNYKQKKNFVELLGQKQIRSRLNGGYGLQQINLGQQIINNEDDNYRRDKRDGTNYMRLADEASEKPLSIKKRFNSVQRVRPGKQALRHYETQDAISENEEFHLIDDKQLLKDLNHNHSKQSLNGWQQGSRDNLNDHSLEYETLLELKNKQKQIFEQQ